MPKLKPETLEARRRQILDAAEVCFASAGFHRTTMQHICSRAGLSAGAVYSHFDSKEDLIAGIAEREAREFADNLAAATAHSGNLLAALEELAEHYTIRESEQKNRLFMEIGCESTRNPTVGETFRQLDQSILDNVRHMLAQAEAQGHIAPELGADKVSRLIQLLGDGLCWRRAVEPAFDVRAYLPAILAMIAGLVRPVDRTGSGADRGGTGGASAAVTDDTARARALADNCEKKESA